MKLIQERYAPKRARIVEEEIPIEFKNALEAKNSIISRILTYLKSLSKEAQVSKQDIADGAGLLNKEQIDGARKNKKVDGLFKRLKINKSHKFRAQTQEDWDWYYTDESDEWSAACYFGVRLIFINETPKNVFRGQRYSLRFVLYAKWRRALRRAKRGKKLPARKSMPEAESPASGIFMSLPLAV